MTKIKDLLSLSPPKAIFTSRWLKERGYYQQLTQQYVKSEWLERIGEGAFKRFAEGLSIFGALWALQQDYPPFIHIGGSSALQLQGFTHTLSFDKTSLILFAQRGKAIPIWFQETQWSYNCVFIRSATFMKTDYTSQEIDGCLVLMSSPELAILEACYLTPKHQSLEGLLHFMESLTSLRPTVLQVLLEGCHSIKTKRLFLFLARKLNHSWFKYMDESKLDLGKGPRQILPGKIDSHYNITLPETYLDE